MTPFKNFNFFLPDKSFTESEIGLIQQQALIKWGFPVQVIRPPRGHILRENDIIKCLPDSNAEELESIKVTVQNLINEHKAYDSRIKSLINENGERDSRIKSLIIENGERDSRIKSLINENGERDSRIKSLINENGERDSRIKSLINENGERDSRIKSLINENGKRDSRIKSLTNDNGERDSRIKSLINENGARDSRIKSLINANGARDSRIKSLINANGERDSRIFALEEEVSTLKGNRLCSKLILFIQDVNAKFSLERKNLSSYSSPLAHIRNVRNDACHYIDQNESELNTAIKLKIGLDYLQSNRKCLIEKLSTISTDVQIERSTKRVINKRFLLLSALVSEIIAFIELKLQENLICDADEQSAVNVTMEAKLFWHMD